MYGSIALDLDLDFVLSFQRREERERGSVVLLCEKKKFVLDTLPERGKFSQEKGEEGKDACEQLAGHHPPHDSPPY